MRGCEAWQIDLSSKLGSFLGYPNVTKSRCCSPLKFEGTNLESSSTDKQLTLGWKSTGEGIFQKSEALGIEPITTMRGTSVPCLTHQHHLDNVSDKMNPGPQVP